MPIRIQVLTEEKHNLGLDGNKEDLFYEEEEETKAETWSGRAVLVLLR